MTEQMRTLSVVLLAITLVAGCGRSPPRVSRQLGTVGGLTVTNSPMLVNEVEPNLDDGRLKLTYSLIFQNTGRHTVTLHLSRASLRTDGLPSAVACSVYGRSNQTRFEPGDRWRVDCVCDFSGEVQRELRRKDADAQLRITFSSDEGQSWIMFEYPMRIEDAS